MSKTLEQLRAEQTRDKALLEQYQHRLERLENRAKYLSKAERTARTHRLITRGAAVESIVPEIKSMAEVPFYSLMEQILSMPDVQTVIRRALHGEDG